MVGWYVYIVRCADGSLYTGITKDVEARVSLHNAGRGAPNPSRYKSPERSDIGHRATMCHVPIWLWPMPS